MPAPAPVRLSKSKFVAGVQCLKRLYLQVHQPELAGESDDAQMTRLEQGHEVGTLAQSRFPRGVLVEEGPERLNEAIARTAALLEDPSVPAIFEATFQHANLLVRVDILERRPGNRWRLIEVKSSAEVKDHHLYDAAIQDHVLTKCGLDISSVCLMHLNREYVYNGKQHDVGQLFTIRNLTKQVRRVEENLPKLLTAQRRALALDAPPDIEPGPHCEEPYRCEFFDHCNPELPEHHISFLPGLHAKKRQSLVELGVSRIPDIPDDFQLTEIQARVRTSVVTGQMWVSDTLQKELKKLKYPLYFMDFESLAPAVPRFAGMRPYAQIPFQWSVHRQHSQDGPLEHFEFLADDDQDPRQPFIDGLCVALGKRGQIVVYNAGFESQRLKELAAWLPQYRGRIENIQSRLWDLWPFVRRHVYHPDFNGSFSIKSVLPALVPDMSYDDMEVAHGEQAGVAWEQMVRGEIGARERQRLKSALLEYCRQDTLAMVRIVERLRELVFGHPKLPSNLISDAKTFSSRGL
jgi:predicted RecB family nuclease